SDSSTGAPRTSRCWLQARKPDGWTSLGTPPPGPRAAVSTTTPSTSTGTPQTTGKRSSRPTITPSDFHINHEGSRNGYTTPRDLTFPSPGLAVVQERADRVVAEAAFECRCGLLLLAVDVDQGGIEVDDQRVLRTSPRSWRVVTREGPGSFTRALAGCRDRSHHSRCVLGQRGQHARDRRSRGDVTEHARLTPQQVGIAGDLPAHRESHRQVQHDLRRVMLGQRLRPR